MENKILNEEYESEKDGNSDLKYKTNDEKILLESQEMNNEERDVMKGDTVGETLYSAKWILNTLISLSNVYESGWNSSLEDDLCMLWDMTSEKDVVEFLVENDFLRMAQFTVKISEEPRLTEIIVGIIGNMCCEKKYLEILGSTDELVDTMLSLISSDDKETLIQVLRILQAAVWDIQVNSQSVWLKKMEECEILGEAITFILKSSTSDELLSPCICFVYSISELELPDEDNIWEKIFKIDQLIFALCESMNELINQEESVHTEAQFKNIEYWINILFNMIKKNLLRFSDEQTDENYEKVNLVLLKILQPFKVISNLNPVEEQCLMCIQQCIKMVSTFQRCDVFFNSRLTQTILHIIVNLKKVITENEFESCDEDSKNLYNYMVNYWIETIKVIDKEEILKIFESCDRETVNNVIELVKSFPNVPENCIAKLLEV